VPAKPVSAKPVPAKPVPDHIIIHIPRSKVAELPVVSNKQNLQVLTNNCTESFSKLKACAEVTVRLDNFHMLCNMYRRRVMKWDRKSPGLLLLNWSLRYAISKIWLLYCWL
jgi:hypothetical protein